MSTASNPRSSPSDVSRHDHSLAQVRFLTVAEVAALMRVSKMTVYRLVHSGELTAVRVGRSFRVPEKAVHDYLRHAYIEAG
jgi:excisionase family DNA binding protein